MPLSNTGKGTAFAIGSLILLGGMPVIANSRPADFGALGFAFWLSVWQSVFAIPLFVWELRTGKGGIFSAQLSATEKRRALLTILFTGVLFGIATYLYVFGVEKAGAVSAAIAIQAYPVFAILLETIFLKRRKTPLELALTAILLISLYYLGTGGTWRIDGLSVWFLVALGTPLVWAVAHIIVKEELGRTPITPVQVTFSRVITSTLFLGIVVAFLEPASFAQGIARLDFQRIALFMGLVYYLELILWFNAVQYIAVSTASSVTTPWPALTMMLSIIFLGDHVEPYQIGAFIVIAACIYGLIIADLRKNAFL
jgi:drug/metabolite transporter (DMT)-like permease